MGQVTVINLQSQNKKLLKTKILTQSIRHNKTRGFIYVHLLINNWPSKFELRTETDEFRAITHFFSLSPEMKSCPKLRSKVYPKGLEKRKRKNYHQVTWEFELTRDVEEVMVILLTHTHLVSRLKVAQNKGLSKRSHERNSKYIKWTKSGHNSCTTPSVSVGQMLPKTNSSPKRF